VAVLANRVTDSDICFPSAQDCSQHCELGEVIVDFLSNQLGIAT
jgi:hypothetical protein